MNVIPERFDDNADEEGDEETRDYYYPGTRFTFVFPERTLYARQFDSSPGEVAIFGTVRGGADRFTDVPYDDPEFAEVAFYLRDEIGVDSVTVFTSAGYLLIDFRKFDERKSPPQEGFHCYECRALIRTGEQRCSKCGWSWIPNPAS